MTYVVRIGRKPMIDSRGENNHIVLAQANANPLIVLAADIKVSLAVEDIANLLVLMQVLRKECLHLLLINSAHGLGRHADLVPVLVSALGRNGVDRFDGWAVLIQDTEGSELLLGDFTAGVVGLALVALCIQKFI